MSERARPDSGTVTSESTSTDEKRTERTDSSRNVRAYVNYAVLVGLCLLALISALQFYLSASQAINTWVTSEYRSLFQAAFNLVVLFVVGAGITLQLRRL